jgi:hypothetical protein
MSRIARFREPPQPTLPLGHGPVHWDTLPGPVRERVLALWMQILTAHLSSRVGPQCDATAIAARPAAGPEDHR